MAKLEVRHLYKIFGPNPEKILPLVQEGIGKEEILQKTRHNVGLTDISLSVEAGSTFVVMGLSGSGKSTLIRCLNRLIEPTAGEIEVDGTDILSLSKKDLQELRRHKISMVFQRFGLLPHRTVIENAGYGLEIQGVKRKEREEKAREWIDRVGLAGYEESYPDQLSGGMQQRVGLARALATDPDILLMDEAFSALDPLIRRGMQDELIKLQQDLHKTIVFITHDLDEALKLGDRIVILKDGVMVQEGTQEDILLHPTDDYVAEFVHDVNRGAVLKTKLVLTEYPSLTLESDSLQTLFRSIQESNRDYAYVTDRDKRFLGVLAADDEQIMHENGGELDDLLHDVPTVTPDTVLEEVLPPMLQARWPLAVVDERGVFLGIVPRNKVFAMLAGEDEETPFEEDLDAVPRSI